MYAPVWRSHLLLYVCDPLTVSFHSPLPLFDAGLSQPIVWKHGSCAPPGDESDPWTRCWKCFQALHPLLRPEMLTLEKPMRREREEHKKLSMLINFCIYASGCFTLCLSLSLCLFLVSMNSLSAFCKACSSAWRAWTVLSSWARWRWFSLPVNIWMTTNTDYKRFTFNLKHIKTGIHTGMFWPHTGHFFLAEVSVSWWLQAPSPHLPRK